jgi:hypothetical protein
MLRTLIAYMPVLVCGVMMLFICVPMLLGRRHNQSANQGASQQEVAELREEISRLKAERALDDKTESLDG